MQHKITDEMITAVWDALCVDIVTREHIRAALEAIAPALRAQGEAKGIRGTIRELENASQLWTHKAHAVVRQLQERAADLEKTTP